MPASSTDKNLFKYVSGSYCVANRSAIKKILYTSEDSPEMVLIHVPPILRPNRQSGTFYFTFELTYMLEVECFHESLQHPQKVPVTNKVVTEAAMEPDIHYDQSLIVPLSRHIHGRIRNVLVHGRTNKVFTSVADKKSVGVKSGNFVNK